MAPPSKDAAQLSSEVHATHAAFSRDGKTVLASFGSEHVYTFARTSAAVNPVTFCKHDYEHLEPQRYGKIINIGLKIDSLPAIIY